MNRLFLFTDGSVNVHTNIGFGACLSIAEDRLSGIDLKSLVKVKRFEDTSSTKLELQTLLWALTEIEDKNQKIITLLEFKFSTLFDNLNYLL